MNVPLVDDRFFGMVAPFFAREGRIEITAPTQDPATGEEIDAWTVVVGLEAVPLAAGNTANEARAQGMTRIDHTRRIALAGSYPEITTAMRIVIDDVAWQIRAVTEDVASASTWLEVERVNPTAEVV